MSVKVQIPDDWAGQWRCVELQWPDSEQWTWLLSGLFSLYFRGRLWDETTGTITEATAIGREIWARNKGFVACGTSGCTTCPSCTTCPTGIIGSSLENGDGDCEDNMVCGKEGAPIKIENGVLYWWSRDCCDWIAIGDIAGVAPTLPEDPLNPDQTPGLTYYACGKANALTEVTFAILQSAWDEYDNFPWQWIANVQTDVGLDLHNTWLINLILLTTQMRLLMYERDSLFSATQQAYMRAFVYNLLADDAAGITVDQYSAVRSAMKSHVMPDPFVMNMYDYVFYALGHANAENITKLGALDGGHDCGIPSPGIQDPTPNWDYTWTHFHDFSSVDSISPWVLGAGTATEHVPGAGLVDYAEVNAGGYAKSDGRFYMLRENCTVKRVMFWYRLGATFLSDVHFTVCTDVHDLIIEADLIGGSPSVGGTFVIDKSMSVAVGATDNRFQMLIEGHLPDNIDPVNPGSPTLVAIALGGIGDNPFTAA